jgi:hypothetical protein
MYYDETTLTLLEPVQSGDKLIFRSNKTGASYEAKPEHTMLIQGTESEINIHEKYKYAIKNAPYDSTNPIVKTTGCPKCGRLCRRFKRFGKNEEVILTCLCGFVEKGSK